MACLSVIQDGGRAVVVANPVFVTSSSGIEVTFEVFEQDAASLKTLVDKQHYYVLDSMTPFWAQLKFLDPCESTHLGLAYLRHKATLRGVLSVIAEAKRMQ